MQNGLFFWGGKTTPNHPNMKNREKMGPNGPGCGPSKINDPVFLLSSHCCYWGDVYLSVACFFEIMSSVDCA